MIPGEKRALDDLAAASIAISCALLADIIKFRADFGFDRKDDAA